MLVPAYLLAARYLLRIRPRGLALAVALAIAALFLLGDGPYFLWQAPPAWLTDGWREALGR